MTVVFDIGRTFRWTFLVNTSGKVGQKRANRETLRPRTGWGRPTLFVADVRAALLMRLWLHSMSVFSPVEVESTQVCTFHIGVSPRAATSLVGNIQASRMYFQPRRWLPTDIPEHLKNAIKYGIEKVARVISTNSSTPLCKTTCPSEKANPPRATKINKR